MSIYTTGLSGNAEYSIALTLYFLFVGKINTELIDAAFGKNNEESISEIGRALAMYAKYKNPEIDIKSSFPTLLTCETLLDIAMDNTALTELYSNTDLVDLVSLSTYANQALSLTPDYIALMKSDKTLFQNVIANVNIVDSIRNNETARAIFNKNRIRILAPGEVSWTVPEDWPLDFIHVQLIGGGGRNSALTATSCGEYVQGFIDVTPGQVITGSIGLGADTVFGDLTARKGEGASQSGAWLVKASNGGGESNHSTAYWYFGGVGGFEGGQGQNGMNNRDHPNQYGNSNNCGRGDGTLGHCEGTGGVGRGYDTAIDGGGGGCKASNYTSDNASTGAAGGGGYGGGPAWSKHYTEKKGWTYYNTADGTSGGSGAIVITCPDGYIPEYVVYNTIDGVTEWRRDENIFNDFGEETIS